MIGRVEALTDRQLSLSEDVQPDWFAGDAVASKLRREFAREAFRSTLAAFAAEELPESCPEPDAAAAKALAQMGLELDLMLQGQRSGHRALWEAWFELVHDRVDSDADRKALLERASEFFFAGADLVSRQVTDVYRREREQMLRSSGQRRMDLVRSLLDGGPVDSKALDWPLEHHHLAIVASDDDAEAAARELSRFLERPLLLVKPIEGWWGWLSANQPMGPSDEAALAKWTPSRGRLAIGLEAPGPEGFRSSHFQATRVKWVARSRDVPCLRFDEVSLEVLAGERSGDARAFVERELGPLNGDAARSRTLRETLAAYFDADQNAAATAGGLGVHEQTVANRLRAIEGLLGHTVASRRPELETALRLQRVLPPGGTPET